MQDYQSALKKGVRPPKGGGTKERATSWVASPQVEKIKRRGFRIEVKGVVVDAPATKFRISREKFYGDGRSQKGFPAYECEVCAKEGVGNGCHSMLTYGIQYLVRGKPRCDASRGPVTGTSVTRGTLPRYRKTRHIPIFSAIGPLLYEECVGWCNDGLKCGFFIS